MKHLTLLAAILAATFALGSCSKAADKPVNAGAEAKATATDSSFADIKAKGFFILGLDDTFPPMGFRDEKGQITGFDIDLAKEAAKRLGIEVRPTPVAWDGVILSLNKKDIDVIWNGLTITDKRKEQIAFSKPYLENRQIIVVTAASKISAKKDLQEKTIGLQQGSSSEEALAADKETSASLKEIRKYPENVTALLDLKAGRVNAVVIDEIVGRYYLTKHPGDYTILAEDFGKEAYGVGYRKTDASFGAELDKVLDAIKSDGTGAAIAKKWFGDDILVK